MIQSLLRALICLFLAVSASFAGNGTFNAGVYNFCVSIRFNATPAQLQRIRDVYTRANQIFADATDGRQRFGTITLVNGNGGQFSASQASEFWILPGTGGAVATYSGFGQRGQHITTYYDSNFAPTNDGSAYTIAHEMAHHAYGLYDEYSRFVKNAAGQNVRSDDGYCSKPPDAATLNFSLMDNYFTRGGRSAGGTTYTLKEFCVRTNHDPDKINFQTLFRGMSAWEWIAQHASRAAAAPPGLPNATAPAVAAPTFVDGAPGLRLSLVIDRSGSMSDEMRITFAKQAATLFVDFMKDGDQMSLISFASSASTDVPLVTISPGTRTQLRAGINSLSASGSTNIGGGLQSGLTSITSGPNRSCDELIVLLTDGDHNTGTNPDTVLPAIRSAGVSVLTVGLGSGISAAGEALLSRIATQSGGKYFGVISNSANLPAIFALINGEATGNGLIAREPISLSPNQPRDTEFLVESASQSVTFGLVRSNPNVPVTTSIRTPGGQLLTSDAQMQSVGATINNSVPGITLVTFANPAAGTWRYSTISTVATSIEVFSTVTNPNYLLVAGSEVTTTQGTQPITLVATPQAGGSNVAGAVVSGFVARPDGSAVPVTLTDDGNNGDTIPGDGIYQFRFSNYNFAGTYILNLTATNRTGFTAPGETFGEPPLPSAPVASFSRVSSNSFAVTNIDACAAPALPLQNSRPVNGSLTAFNCLTPRRSGRHSVRYSFSGTQGQQVSLLMTSPDTDTYLILVGPNGSVLVQDDDGGGNDNARIPATGFYSLPQTGTYIVEATTFSSGDTGPYELTLNFSLGQTGCTYTVSPASVPAATPWQGVGNSVLTIATAANCTWATASNASWAQNFPPTGTGNGSTNYTILPNFNSQQRTATYTVADKTITVTQTANPGSFNQRFISLLYYTMLGRLPVQSEIDFHVGTIVAGTPRPDITRNFFDSIEFGIGGRYISGAYAGLLNRDAEFAGWLFQRNALVGGFTNQISLVGNFLASNEYRVAFASPNNQDFVRLLYRYILFREPSQGEVDFQINNAVTPHGRSQTAANFLNSNEFRVRTTARLQTLLLHFALLQRDPTAAERQATLSQLQSGSPVRDLINAIISSQEFNDRLI